MIKITNIRNVKKGEFDEVWAIVRSLKSKSPWVRQVADLSPSWDTFKAYLNSKNAGTWNEKAFREDYLPAFLENVQSNPNAEKLIEELIAKDMAGKNIALVCFCPDETLCHRSIVAGMLQKRNIKVEGVAKDYSDLLD